MPEQHTEYVSDDFLPIARRYAESLDRWYNLCRIYGCGSCGCVFIPEAEEGEDYPDRFEMAGGCDSPDCDCHTIPRTMDVDGTPLAGDPTLNDRPGGNG